MKRFNCDFGSRFRILKGGKISLVVSAILSSTTLVFANPTGGTVTSGTANISQSGNTTNITQSTNKASINWQDFSIKSNETVNFKQPNVNSITLNRVVGNERSIIDGALNANGQVWILNSNGILFNKDSKINTAGILATTKNISDADFNAGNYKFTGNSTAGVINMGTIEASDSGYVALLANTVQNNGTIKAYKGTVHLTGASEATINLNGNSIVSLTVNKGVLDALVENKGAVLADGGKIFLTTNAVDEILKGVVNNTGLIEAKRIDDISGEIILFAHGGTAKVSGTIEAIGGFVETSGRELQIDATAKIQAKTWLLDPINVTIADSGDLINYPLGEGEKSNNGSTVSASAIMAALATTDVIISTTGDGADEGNIYVNSSITYGGTHGLYLKAYNDININADITVNDTASLYLQYGWNGGNSYGNRGGINLKMNADHTTFGAKVTLNDTSKFYSVGDAGSGSVEYTVIRDRAGLSAIDSNYAFYKMLPLGHPSRPAANVVEASLAGKYVLGGDIDLSAYSLKTIGGGDYDFTGVFNGLGHTIDGMNIDDTVGTGGKGLFSGIYGGSVSNLALTNVDISGTGNNYGALAGWMRDASISNMILQGSVKGTKDASDGYFGGLIGYTNNVIIDNVHADVDVEGSQYVGGLVGYGEGYLTITDSSSKGDVKFAYEGAGGLVGYFDGDGLMIEKSFNTGNIGAMADTTDYAIRYAGGLVGYVRGYADGYIKESFNTGSVAGTAFVGGIVGYINRGLPVISDTFNTGTVTAIGNTANNIGGFIGYVGRTTEITNAYNSGDVLSQAVTSSENVGGFIGGVDDTTVTINNSFSKGTVQGTTNVGGFIGILENDASADISNSFTATNVTGVTNVGGFIGLIDGDDTVTLNNVSVSGAVSGSTAVGGVIGESGANEIDNPNLGLTNVLWSSTTSGQANAVGRAFESAEYVNLYSVADDDYYYMPLNTNNANYKVSAGASVQYNYDTHYQTLVDNGDTRTGGTVQTGIFTNTSASALTTAKNAIMATAFPEPTWVINANANGGLPSLAWSESGSTPTPVSEPTPTPVPNPEPTKTAPIKQDTNIEKVITTIVNNTINNVNLPKDILLPKVNLVQNMPILPMTPTVQSSPMMQNIAQKLGVNQSEELSLVSTTLEGQSTERITLGELKNLSKDSNNSNSEGNIPLETRVAVGDNSIIELVNGGMALPEGVDQEFYVVKNKKNNK